MWEDEVEALLELYSIEEALEILDITPNETIEILLRHGYAVLPPFLQREDDEDRDEEDE